MNIRKVKYAVREVAKRHGVSEKRVVSEIQFAIEKALEMAKREENAEVLSRWKEIPSEGDVPTAYELLVYLEERVRKFP